MARLDQGLLGGYSGKLGTTVGASWKGINVVRTYQPTVANPNSLAQQKQRNIFSDWVALASYLLPSVVKPLWDRKATKMSGYNAFIQANLNASKADGVIDPMKMVLSQGLMGPTDLEMTLSNASTELSIVWDNDRLPTYASLNDKLFMLIFNAEGELLYHSAGLYSRADGDLSVSVKMLEGATEAFIVTAWQSVDGKFQSNTRRQEVKGA